MYRYRIDDDSFMVAYVDVSTDSGITAVLVNAPSNDLAVIRVGSRLAVSTGNSQTGAGFGQYKLSMDFSVTPVAAADAASSPGAVILFADVGNNAKWTAAVLQVTSANEIVRASPHFVLNKDSTIGINSNAGKDSSGALISYTFNAASSSSSPSRVALFTSTSDKVCSSPDETHFSVMELKAGVGGVSASGSSGGSTEVDIAGTVSGLAGLSTGSVYVSDTRGNLIQSSIFLGATYAPLYDYVETDSTIVSMDSVVGIAVSDSKIALVSV
jgi:hypothetical protein